MFFADRFLSLVIEHAMILNTKEPAFYGLPVSSLVFSFANPFKIRHLNIWVKRRDDSVWFAFLFVRTPSNAARWFLALSESFKRKALCLLTPTRTSLIHVKFKFQRTKCTIKHLEVWVDDLKSGTTATTLLSSSLHTGCQQPPAEEPEEAANTASETTSSSPNGGDPPAEAVTIERRSSSPTTTTLLNSPKTESSTLPANTNTGNVSTASGTTNLPDTSTAIPSLITTADGGNLSTQLKSSSTQQAPPIVPPLLGIPSSHTQQQNHQQVRHNNQQKFAVPAIPG